jgi:hypothetical protein
MTLTRLRGVLFGAVTLGLFNGGGVKTVLPKIINVEPETPTKSFDEDLRENSIHLAYQVFLERFNTSEKPDFYTFLTNQKSSGLYTRETIAGAYVYTDTKTRHTLKISLSGNILESNGVKKI